MDIDEKDLVIESQVEDLPILPVEEDTPVVPEDKPVVDTPEDVDRARRMGWIPKESFKGDPGKWRPASEFLKRGDEELPIARERLRKLDQKLNDIQSNMSEFVKFTRAAAQREADAKIAELQAAKDEAFDKGDKEAFLDADKALKEIETKPVETKEKVKAEPPPEIQNWFDANPWYQSDKKMQAYADHIADFIKRETELDTGAPLLGTPLLERVRQEVERKFPDKFSNPNRQRPGAVGSAGGNLTDHAGGKKGKSFHDLPREAQVTCNNWVSQGLGTKEEYLKFYDWS